MVTKKYLCAAPRPETWDEKAEAILQSVGGDKAKRDKFVQQTLRQLKALKYVFGTVWECVFEEQTIRSISLLLVTQRTMSNPLNLF